MNDSYFVTANVYQALLYRALFACFWQFRVLTPNHMALSANFVYLMVKQCAVPHNELLDPYPPDRRVPL